VGVRNVTTGGCPIKISSIITSHPSASNLLARALSPLSNTYTQYVLDDKKIDLCPCGIERHYFLIRRHSFFNISRGKKI
jgi:hypothetical protein